MRFTRLHHVTKVEAVTHVHLLLPPHDSRDHEQPVTIRETLNQEEPRIAASRHSARRRPSFVVLAARGTSDNAGTYLRYVMGAVNGMVVARAAPSLLTVYRSRMQIEDAAVIGISQSGKATDVIEVLDTARRLGAMTIALTNTADSPIVQASEFSLLTHAREEKAVAATKTYTSALAVLHQLAGCWAQRSDLQESIHRAPEVIEQVFSELEPRIAARSGATPSWIPARSIAGLTMPRRRGWASSSGCCLINPETWSAADYMHGPIAALHTGDPVLLLAPHDPSLTSMLEVARAVERRRGDDNFSDDPDALALASIR